MKKAATLTTVGILFTAVALAGLAGGVLALGLLLLIGLLLVLVGALWLFPRRRTYGRAVVTRSGERFRSVSEMRIASYFRQKGIQYRYEETARARNGRKISRPDFYLPQYDVYVEFWGLLNADDARTRKDYERTMKWKMSQYHRNGIRFVSIYPRDLNDLGSVFTARLREVTGYELQGGGQSTVTAQYCTTCGSKVNRGDRYCTGCGNPAT